MKISKMLDEGKLDNKTIVILTPLAPWKRTSKVYVMTDTLRLYGIDGNNRIWVCHRIHKIGTEIWWCKNDGLEATRPLVGSVQYRIEQIRRAKYKVCEKPYCFYIKDFWLGTEERQ